MIKLYNIGFTQKTALQFFGILKQNHIDCVVDIRLNPNGQLSRFAFKNDLPYFLEHLAGGCRYCYRVDLAPTRELLSQVRDKSDPMSRDYKLFEQAFVRQLQEHSHIADFAESFAAFHHVALLCSEPGNAKCHRRLVSDMLLAMFPDDITFGGNL